MNVAPYTLLEDRLHAAIHGAGLLVGLVAVPWLVLAAAGSGNLLRVLGVAAFGISALLVLSTSTIYHSSFDPVVRLRWRQLDHAAIYLLIAGSYTPFAIGVLRGAWGWSLFAVVWGVALLGIATKLRVGFKYTRLSTAYYLVMGWAGIVAIKPLMAALSTESLAWIAAGGLFYTLGVPFYLWKTRRYTHVVWHVSVLAGICCHFMAVRGILP